MVLVLDGLVELTLEARFLSYDLVKVGLKPVIICYLGGIYIETLQRVQCSLPRE